jgi:hypothetical protein
MRPRLSGKCFNFEVHLRCDGAERFGSVRVVGRDGARAQINGCAGGVVCDGMQVVSPVTQSGRAAVIRH